MFKILSVILTKRNGTGLPLRQSVFYSKVDKKAVEKVNSENIEKLEQTLKGKFFYDQSFSIYGGSSGFFDLGPLGCLLQNNLVSEWRKHFVLNDKMLEVDCSILTPELVLKASGHLSKFSDIMLRDVVTNDSFRADHLIKAELEKTIKKGKSNKSINVEEAKQTMIKIKNGQFSNLNEIDDIVRKYKIKSPTTGNELSNATPFNLMFQTQIGPCGSTKGYMRPETAQGIFLNFKRLYGFNQKKLPLIVAQVGKSFRNEINPKSGLIRQREFLMAEIEHFLDPNMKYVSYEKFKSVENLELSIYSSKDQLDLKGHQKMKLSHAVKENVIKSETLAYYIGRVYLFVKNCGVDENKIRFRQHLDTEMAHYANECWDLECETSLGWIECAGLADRCDYDLKQHSEFSGQALVAEKPGAKKVLNTKQEVLAELKENKNLETCLGKNQTDLLLEFIDTKFNEFIKQIPNELSSNKDMKSIKIDEKNAINLKPDDFNELFSSFGEKEKATTFIPHVIEPSFGIGRIMYTILEHNFKFRENNKSRVFFSFPYSIAPYKCCILPLNESELKFQPFIHEISNILTQNSIMHKIDDASGSIGRRYTRNDECGIPFSITLDYDTFNDNSVTIRERDSMKQLRVKIENIVDILKSKDAKTKIIE